MKEEGCLFVKSLTGWLAPGMLCPDEGRGGGRLGGGFGAAQLVVQRLGLSIAAAFPFALCNMLSLLPVVLVLLLSLFSGNARINNFRMFYSKIDFQICIFSIFPNYRPARITSCLPVGWLFVGRV